MFTFWVTLCVIFLLVTGAVHSIAGERYLLRPLFRKRGNAVLENALARMVLRFAWHITSLSWAVLAIALYALAFRPDTLVEITLGSIGVVFTAVGLFDLVVSRGRHVGWPFLTLIGIFALLAVWSGLPPS